MDSVIRFEIPTNMDFDAMILNNNYTEIISDLQKRLENTNTSDAKENFLENYGTLTVTVWIAIVMVFCLATVIFCICSCMFYSKIRRWNRNEEIRRQQENIESNYQNRLKEDILPSYTLVSGLPTYDAALEQYCQTKNALLEQSARPTVFQIFRFENEKLNASEPISWKLPAILTTTSSSSSTTEQQQSLPIYDELKQPIVDTRNDRLCLFISRLQSQISTDSSVSCVSEKSQYHEKESS